MSVVQMKVRPETHAQEVAPGVRIPARAWSPAAREVLTPAAANLLASLHRALEPERQMLLAARRKWQAHIDGGALPEYLPRTSPAAQGTWRVTPLPADLMTRRVEITGPANSAKMVINMLSRGADGVRADTAMLDMEDAMKPEWGHVMASILNIRDAAAGTLTHEEPGPSGTKAYKLDPKDRAVIIIRPRGLHLNEVNLTVDGTPVSGGLLDLVLTAVHSAPALVAQGLTPAYYIPKAEHAGEARWWSEALAKLEDALGFSRGTCKATFLIETLPAAYEMEEILFEAREHAVGLNVGRWDKIFSDIKTLKRHSGRILADRARIGMDQPWMGNYALRCVQIAHGRGAMGIGGMAAFTPGRTAEVRAQQAAKVVADKTLEAERGHDGAWVSHPYFIGPALSAFKRANQLDVLHAGRDKYPDLLPQGGTQRTLAGLRTNVRVGIGYLHGWQRGIGCVAWDNLMEDLATLEISRAQTWQWMHYGVQLEDGQRADEALVRSVFAEELQRIRGEVREGLHGPAGAALEESFAAAAQEAERVFTRPELTDFLTLDSEPV